MGSNGEKEKGLSAESVVVYFVFGQVVSKIWLFVRMCSDIWRTRVVPGLVLGFN